MLLGVFDLSLFDINCIVVFESVVVWFEVGDADVSWSVSVCEGGIV